MSLSAGGFADQRNSDRKAGGLEHWATETKDTEMTLKTGFLDTEVEKNEAVSSID